MWGWLIQKKQLSWHTELIRIISNQSGSNIGISCHEEQYKDTCKQHWGSSSL